MVLNVSIKERERIIRSFKRVCVVLCRTDRVGRVDKPTRSTTLLFRGGPRSLPHHAVESVEGALCGNATLWRGAAGTRPTEPRVDAGKSRGADSSRSPEGLTLLLARRAN
jgi:hypothetical protein